MVIGNCAVHSISILVNISITAMAVWVWHESGTKQFRFSLYLDSRKLTQICLFLNKLCPYKLV